MALMNEYPVISSNLKVGYGVYGTADPYNAALPNNGALNPPGSVFFIPAPSQSGLNLSSASGYAAGLWVKYVLYKSTANPAVVTGPAPVYYTDETFTTVSGVYTEGLVSGTGSSISAAGWLLPNSGTVTNVGLGTTLFTATILNNSTLGSWVWIGLQGFIPSAYLSAGALYNGVYGSAGNWVVTAQAAGSIAYKNMGFILATPSSNIADILATLPIF